ncbi:predicted protein [Paecilomyces variotii No. 5]|uniref:Uncharacterized protein n=1 Tax=Byssochlamys spectabilis (strain No. 5 / NBRC 109023) TaxID=1356009 RepID=V5FJI7_BYSSN|nr:predicted protein [Paecilomyces variotii No. 5]
MPPFVAVPRQRSLDFNTSQIQLELRAQWLHPSEAFSVLLILGGDVVGRALAQFSGSGIAPVTFSFGWVAYSISALVSAFGENRLMPQEPDYKCKVINGLSGYARENSSWILGRMVRDFDHWSHFATRKKTQEILETRWKELLEKKGVVAGVVTNDWIYWSGVMSMAVQLVIAAIPLGLFGDWGIMMITIAGNALAVATGLLPQWRKEKWACRRAARDPYILTRGNGAQHALVVLGNQRGFNLEDLASGRSNIDVVGGTTTTTRILLLILSALWIVLLITAAGLKTNTWFLLAVGGLGIVQNIFMVGLPRRPENFGIPLEYLNVYGEPKVMKTLLAVERDYPGLGRSMREEFFPGDLRPGEIQQWKELEEREELAL